MDTKMDTKFEELKKWIISELGGFESQIKKGSANEYTLGNRDCYSRTLDKINDLEKKKLNTVNKVGEINKASDNI